MACANGSIPLSGITSRALLLQTFKVASPSTRPVPATHYNNCPGIRFQWHVFNHKAILQLIEGVPYWKKAQGPRKKLTDQSKACLSGAVNVA